MKIIATNIGVPTAFEWNGAQEYTGIFKYPAPGPLSLKKDKVASDTIIDRKHHGGHNKACYLYSADHYPYWQDYYPTLDWDWGMFGENLTVSDMDESQMRIGDIYKIGTAIVQVSQPREPCYKLGVRFQDQSILKQFIAYAHSGTYVRILEPGLVEQGDTMELVEQSPNPLTVMQFFELLYERPKRTELIQMALTNDAVPEYKKKHFEKFLK